jgi:hypothetical protein
MDAVSPPATILRTSDDQSGWDVIHRLIVALERSGLRSLYPRPLEVGEIGSSDCWVIA